MSKRKSMSRKLRFEVFKRDRFTCQYCGAKAPDVILHVDHIHPVAAGGSDEILNLVTACATCNGGKGARLLDDRSEIERQRGQLIELEERRDQLQMMLEWRDAVNEDAIDAVEAVSSRIGGRSGIWPNENGKAHIRRWLKRYSMAEILSAMDESFDRHMTWRGENPCSEDWETAFKKIPVHVTYAQRAAERPWLGKIAYIQGILRRRFSRPNDRYMVALESYHVDDGVPLDVMEDAAKAAADWEQYCFALNDTITPAGDANGQD